MALTVPFRNDAARAYQVSGELYFASREALEAAAALSSDAVHDFLISKSGSPPAAFPITTSQSNTKADLATLRSAIVTQTGRQLLIYAYHYESRTRVRNRSLQRRGAALPRLRPRRVAGARRTPSCGARIASRSPGPASRCGPAPSIDHRSRNNGAAYDRRIVPPDRTHRYPRKKRRAVTTRSGSDDFHSNNWAAS